MTDDQVLRAAGIAASCWSGDPGALVHLGTSENAVFRFRSGKVHRILRLTAPEHRSPEQIAAELEFVKYLRGHGVAASVPIPSSSGNEIEVTEGGLFASVFDEALGERFRYNEASDPCEHFRTVGRTLGRIHSISRRFRPSGPRRFHWHEDPRLANMRELIASDEVVLREYDDIMDWLRRQPMDEASFGLIHGDFGATNYLRRNGELEVFDFDDACYHWFAYDLAIVLYPHGWRKEAAALYGTLTQGYAEEATWDDRPLEAMTPWCRLRMLYMYLHQTRRWHGREMPPEQAEWMAKTRHNIARGYTFAT